MTKQTQYSPADWYLKPRGFKKVLKFSVSSILKFDVKK